MSDKKVILDAQSELSNIQIKTVEEIHDHLLKAMSIIDVVSNSIEGKNKDNVLDLASELNSMVSVYDELAHAIEDTDEVLKALDETKAVDEKNA